MAVPLADRLAVARRQGFVGRQPELAVFSDLLSADASACVLFVVGPGGVGKTTLLRQYAALAESAGRPVAWLDCRGLGSTVASARAALADAGLAEAGLAEAGLVEAGLADAAPAGSSQPLLVLDTAEALGPLDQWLRDDVLPGLPAGALAVIAGRDPPPIAWRADPGWRSLLRVIRLANLGPDEAAELLRRCGMPEPAHAEALRLTHGHPLALALMADICRHTGSAPTPADTQEMFAALVAHLIDAVPTGRHRAALEASAQVRVTTEPVLAALLGEPDCHDLFEWLRGLSVIEYSARGLFPHDLARDALAAELRWRHPEQHAAIRARARAYYHGRFAGADEATQHGILADLAYLHRGSPGLSAMLANLAPAAEATGVDPAWPALAPAAAADLPGLRAMVVAHEGEESARLFDHWCAQQPGSIHAVRDGAGSPAGLVVLLALERTDAAQRRPDPAAVATWGWLERYAPVGPADRVTLVRFWLDAVAYQQVSPVQTLLTLHLVRHYLTTPGLAYHFFPAAEPDAWASVCAYADVSRLPEADFAVGGRRYGVYGHDWRATPPPAWLARLAALEATGTAPGVGTASGIGTAPGVGAASGTLVGGVVGGLVGSVVGGVVGGLAEAEFAAAVRAALRDLDRPDRLADSALVRSAAAVDRVSAAVDRASADRTGLAAGRAVAGMIRAAADELARSARDRSAYRALHHTYLQPAGTQQAAADLLDLPMSTYRRHLAAGVRRLTEILWRQEIR